ncbi:MAG: nitrate ABC transporter substrate-binding protein [Gordonia sp. (in: high G+C Gram-positive bacteria)]|uniref:nitrate ABC transporter substrate-binding protein n=1 Tax=Gordonia sp. (in: high G+C Gram-positive bacteria) TaxID=84139 RepID=UPI0039E2F5AD
MTTRSTRTAGGRRRSRTLRTGLAGLTGLLAAGSLVACNSSTTGADVHYDPAPAAQQLADVCPATLVVQLQWQPQADMGGVFELLGDDYTVDTDKKSVTGTLVAGGKDTGISLELRAGGPAIGFQSVASRMYVDDATHLGLVHGEQIITASGSQKVVGVTPLLTHNPAIVMWDPAAHPGLTLKTLKDSDTTVVVSKEQIFPKWLVAKGMVKESQLDPGYDGNPARFVADSKIAQQGYVTSEPYTYEHDTPSWNKPVGYGMLADVGFDPYAANVSVRADKLAEMTPCLKKLVPIIQRAGADYITSPGATNRRIVDVVAKDAGNSPYTLGEAEYAAATMKEKGLISNENGSVGTYDVARVAAFVADIAPIAAQDGSGVDPKVDPATLFDPQFGDPSIAVE